jgi:hypothetical protein
MWVKDRPGDQSETGTVTETLPGTGPAAGAEKKRETATAISPVSSIC